MARTRSPARRRPSPRARLLLGGLLVGGDGLIAVEHQRERQHEPRVVATVHATVCTAAEEFLPVEGEFVVRYVAVVVVRGQPMGGRAHDGSSALQGLAAELPLYGLRMRGDAQYAA